MHSFRKLLSLIALYAVIIVGIFVIQFSSDSVIRKNIHGIRVTLAQTENANGTTGLKNNFQISYGGILFSASENFPITYYKDGVAYSAKLVSFEERNDNSCALGFEDDIKLVFSLKEENEQTTFWINAEMPENIERINIRFVPTSGYSITELKPKSVVFAGKKTSSQSNEAYSLNAAELFEGVLSLQKDSPSAYYALVVEQSELSLDNIESFALASKEAYQTTIKSFRETIISEFINAAENEAGFASSLNEQTVISFLAEMTSAGRYNEGIDIVPNQFINGTRRTFLSSPFFGGLAATLPTLTMQVNNFNNMIERAVKEQSIDVFTVQNITQYMYTQGNRGHIAQLVRVPASLTELNLNVENAAGIIRSYTYFKKQNSSLAKPLEPVLELCVQKLVDSVAIEGEKIVVKENETPVSTYAAVSAGDALISYGKEFDQNKFEHFGYLIINSYIGDARGFELRVLGDVYPILVNNNKYYPHFELIKTMEVNNIWAYTISPNIKYSTDENLTISLDVEFPVGLSHYSFVFGIPAFIRIQIYNMDFRTDARFETYNSSGYVYRRNDRISLFKFRHRDRNEIVRFFYRNVPQNIEKNETE